MKKVEKKTFVCNVCGKPFQYYDLKYRVPKYCSRECWNIRNPKILNNCLYCGKEYWQWKSQEHVYCSPKCDDMHRRELKSGSNSHLWRGGKTALNQLERARAKYREWRTAVFIRDEYTCQNCGIKNGLGKKIYLHAHHIKHFAIEPNLRYDVSNGLTLCKNCHLLKHDHKF